MSIPDFHVIGASQIKDWLLKHPGDLVELVEQTYLLHSDKKAINPDSYFLRFPHDQTNRIIALPASLEDDTPLAGIKWISSFPANIGAGLDRASAVLIVNDRQTGYPRACLEGSVISAARTAAAAVVGARHLHPTPNQIRHLTVVGCGLIAYQSIELLRKLGWTISHMSLVDTSPARASRFADKCRTKLGVETGLAQLADAIPQSDLVLFATSAGTPYVLDPEWFRHAPTVLHLSLRDLAPEVILAAQNVVDDVDHCLKAQTSLHLTEQIVGTRDFVAGNAAALIRGWFKPDHMRARIFSPFGMGVLDLAVARAILESLDPAQLHAIPDFFPTPYVA
ncbi:MAG: 2,3-diaminopropionate biosynthesis protein SbnB [Betaproteobacteria bacterium]|nr:2,3-diaminopropionate biosynthesis protein SbnB [Betaproteobacteria bacterium]